MHREYDIILLRSGLSGVLGETGPMLETSSIFEIFRTICVRRIGPVAGRSDKWISSVYDCIDINKQRYSARFHNGTQLGYNYFKHVAFCFPLAVVYSLFL